MAKYLIQAVANRDGTKYFYSRVTNRHAINELKSVAHRFSSRELAERELAHIGPLFFTGTTTSIVEE